MPNKAFAAKRARQAEKRRLRNRIMKKRIKTQLKKILALIEEKKEKNEIIEALNLYQSLCDKAVKKGVIHKNNAARKKSRAFRIVNNYLKAVS